MINRYFLNGLQETDGKASFTHKTKKILKIVNGFWKWCFTVPAISDFPFFIFFSVVNNKMKGSICIQRKKKKGLRNR